MLSLEPPFDGARLQCKGIFAMPYVSNEQGIYCIFIIFTYW